MSRRVKFHAKPNLGVAKSVKDGKADRVEPISIEPEPETAPEDEAAPIPEQMPVPEAFGGVSDIPDAALNVIEATEQTLKDVLDESQASVSASTSNQVQHFIVVPKKGVTITKTYNS